MNINSTVKLSTTMDLNMIAHVIISISSIISNINKETVTTATSSDSSALAMVDT
jgi:hypothetical protein